MNDPSYNAPAMQAFDDAMPEPVHEEFLRLTAQALGSLSGGTIEVSRRTQSMAPLFHGGERLAWRRPERTPRVGDLLLYLQRPGPIVHRVLARRRGPEGRFRTKGDARPMRDLADVRDGEVLGVVIAFERDGEVFSLEGRGPRRYATAAALVSRAGDVGFRAASLGDSILRRPLFFLGDRRYLRRPAWSLQWLSQRALHRLLFRACHPRLPQLPFLGEAR